jgi:hypothetical protein
VRSLSPFAPRKLRYFRGAKGDESLGAMASLAWREMARRLSMDSAATQGWPCAARERAWPLKAGDWSLRKDLRQSEEIALTIFL